MFSFSFPSSSLLPFHIPITPNMIIVSFLLVISLFFSCCYFSFLFSLSLLHFRCTNFFPILQISSRPFFFTFFLILLFQPSFPHSLALLITGFIIIILFIFLIISTSFLFSPPFLPLAFLPSLSSSSYPNYISVIISSIFLVISWEQCSPLPHFIHPCWLAKSVILIPFIMGYVVGLGLQNPELKILEKVYFRSQILECPSIGKYWNISAVLVLPENVIFMFFRTCWWHPEANNTGMPKWSSIAQYSCTSIWDLNFTFSKILFQYE